MHFLFKKIILYANEKVKGERRISRKGIAGVTKVTETKALYDVIVIGGGVVGSLTARELTRLGARVLVLEAKSDVAAGTTAANSGIVHAGFDALPGTNKAKLNVRGAEMMPALTRELSVRYKQIGALVTASGEEGLKGLEELFDRGQKNGVSGLSIVRGEELRALEPNLSPEYDCALLAKTSGIVCPYGLAIAAMGNAMDNGAVLLRNTPVTSIESIEGGYLVNKAYFAPAVVDAAGLAAHEVAKMAGVTGLKQHPRRGEYLLLDRNCGGIVSHTVFTLPTKAGKGILVSPTADGNLLLGPTAEDLPEGANCAVTSAGQDKIIETARRMVPSVPVGGRITSFAGLRAVGESGDFEITFRNGFLALTGIESPGLSAAPAIAELIGQTLGKAGLLPEKPMANFNPVRTVVRPKELDDVARDALIRRDPAYGRIVCRCEEVSEGEIRDALRQNPPALTLDGIKRRTRAMMGRCQGGFCTPSLLALVSRERGIAETDVTKGDGESYIAHERTKGGN